MDKLASAVTETGRYAASKSWGQPPRLYALVRRAALAPLSSDLSPDVKAAAHDSLIPIEQAPLPEGEPAEVLASVQWPDDVDGCVLVTELLVLPPGSQGQVPDERQAAARPGGREARLTVGVLRNGDYASCLQLKGEEDLLLGDTPVDDVVTALLGTF